MDIYHKSWQYKWNNIFYITKYSTSTNFILLFMYQTLTALLFTTEPFYNLFLPLLIQPYSVMLCTRWDMYAPMVPHYSLWVIQLYYIFMIFVDKYCFSLTFVLKCCVYCIDLSFITLLCCCLFHSSICAWFICSSVYAYTLHPVPAHHHPCYVNDLTFVSAI